MLTSKKLAALPEELGYSAEALTRFVVRFDLAGAEGYHSARLELRRLADRTIENWALVAERERIPLLTLLRNLIALSSRRDLPVYRVLIDSPAASALSSDVRAALPGIRAQLGPIPEAWRLLEVLLYRRRTPRIVELEQAALLDPLRAMRAVLSVASDRRALSPRRWAAILTRLESPERGATLPVDVLAAAATSTPLPRLGVRDLNRLPTRMRRELLASERAKELLLTRSLAERLRADPLAHPDTIESIVRRVDLQARKVQSTLARRRMSPEVLDWIRSADVSDEERNRILWAGVESGSGSPAEAVPELAAAAREPTLDDVLQAALAFIAEPAKHRLEAVARYEAWSQLAPRLPADDWVVALLATKKPTLRSKAAGHLARKGREDVLHPLIHHAIRGKAAAASALHAWHESAPRLLALRAATRPALARLLEASSPSQASALVYLEELVSRAPAALAATILAARLTHRKIGRWDTALLSVVASVVARFAARSETAALRKILRASVGADPSGEILEKLVGTPPVQGEAQARILAELLHLPRRLETEEGTAERLGRIVAAWVSVWSGELQRLRAARQPVPAPLARFVALGGEEAVWTALRAYPAGFLRTALRHLPLRSVLRVAFEEAEIADAVDRLVPRKRLRAQIPWVREEYADQPSPATAYEVALAFSLRDVAFLLQLARRAGPPSGGEAAGTRFDDLYRTYPLPKRSGGTRLITAPSKGLKRLQRRLLDLGFAEVPLHRAATGFLRGSSTLENARPHVGRQMVVNADIESFFPRTSHAHILRACRKLAGGMLSERAIRFVADLCSYGGGLPIGAPTSPAIGNIVLTPPDRAIDRAAKRFGIAYTRYADDLTFSGGGDCHRILPFVEKVLGGLGYELKRKKINLFRKGRRQVVTGLVVNEKPNLPRRIRRRLRAAVHHRTNGREPHWHRRPMSDEELFGRLAVLNPVQPEEALRLRSALKRARAESPPPEE
jgi:retron-type reverse transcriptase